MLFDQASQAFGQTATLTWAHTVGAGSGRILIVGISNRDGNKPVTGVTYAGLAMTQATVQNGPGNANRADMYYLLNPPVGTANVVATVSNNVDVVGGAVSFTGTDGAAPSAFLPASGNSSTASLFNLLGSQRDVVVDTLAVNGDAQSATADPPQTERWNAQTGTGGGQIIGGGSTQPGQFLLPSDSWSLGGSKPWALVAVSISPAC